MKRSMLLGFVLVVLSTGTAFAQRTIYVTSAKIGLGDGTVWFATAPAYHYGGSSESDKCIFSDHAIDLYENRGALGAICEWLVD